MISEWIITYRGEVAALLSALLWAIAAVLYQQVGDRIPPLQLTLLKGAIAIALILLTLLLRGTVLPQIPGRSLLLLAASGGLGISLGDTAFFHALNRLGSRRTLLLQTLSPALTALIAAVVLAELLSPRSGIGMMLILLGVA
ncbi:MAG: EamA family transporter, partial [Phormidium sp.]